ncbi:MAG: hypothetical protein RL357_660 [Pseudomonadota bacterium]
MFKKEKIPALKSLVATGTHIQGDITFEDGLRVDGTITGNVIATADKPSVLVVGPGALIQGQVVAEHVIVNGKIEGPVIAKQLAELQPNAVVYGDVNYKQIELHLGAMVTGRLCPIADGELQNPNAGGGLLAPVHTEDPLL